ncbi:hypothetical protein NN561_006309 [Cricetulus griseus]
MHLWVLATAEAAVPFCGPFSSRGPTGNPAASPAGWRTPERGLCVRAASRPATPPRRMIRNSIRPGFCRPPRSRSGDWRRRGLRRLGGGWGWEREVRTAHARRRGRGLPAPPAPSGRNPRAAAPPGAARSRPRPDSRRPGGASFLGPRPRARRREGTFLALPARLRPFPLLPRRVFSAPVKIVPHK